MKRRVFLAVLTALLVCLWPAVASAEAPRSAIYGPERYSTAEIATRMYAFPAGTTATAAVVVPGYAYTNSAAAMALAAALDGPVVPTLPSSLSAASSQTLTRLGVKNVTILANNTDVSLAVETQLASLLGPSGTVRRISGANPYEISENAARAASVGATPVAEAFLVPWAPNSPAYDHELSFAVAPYAYSHKAPIIFTDPSELSATAASALRAIGAKHAIIVGSWLYASPQLEDDLADYGITSERLQERGRDSFGAEAAEWGMTRGWGDPTKLTLMGSARYFSDLLVSGMVSGRLGGVSVFSDAMRPSFAARDFITRHSCNILPLGYAFSAPPLLPSGLLGSIAGTVTAEGTTTPLGGIKVTAWGWDNYSANIPYYRAGSATTAPDGSYAIDRLEPTRYWLTFEDPTGVHFDESYDNAPPSPTHGDLVPVSAGTTAVVSPGLMSDPQWSAQRVERLSGADRYETVVRISAATYKSSDRAVIVTGQNFADALSASALAGAYGAPLLLTRTYSLPPAVTAELRRLGVKSVLIVGGYPAVSQGVENSLRNAGVNVEKRLAGGDRYDTSAKVYAYLRQNCPNVTTEPFLVRGDMFPDALAAAPFAYRQARPIVLVRPTVAPDPIMNLFYTYKIGSAIVVGSDTAVSDDVLSDLAWANGSNELWALRLEGGDRYATALAVATAWGHGFDYIGVATGLDFPDALSGGAAAGARAGALVLSRPTGLRDDARAFVDDNSPWLWQVRLFGGSNVLGDAVRNDVAGRFGTGSLSVQSAPIKEQPRGRFVEYQGR